MKNKSLLWILIVILCAVSVIYLSTQLSGQYLSNKKEKTGVECPQIGQEHFVEVKGSKMQPEVTNTKLCDKLTIINKDDKLRRIAFGEHDKHVAYNGVIEKILQKGQSFTIVLNQPGQFLFHDHLQEEVQATFIVKN